MESAILEAGKAQGLWALLFVFLLFYILKENSKREGKYQEIIEKFNAHFSALESRLTSIDEKLTKVNVINENRRNVI